MKKSKLFCMVCTVVLAAALLACGKQDKVDPVLLQPFLGKWQCAENPMENPEYYTGFLVLCVEDDGSFRMYDAEAGNPGISGTLQILSETELVLICNTEDDFDPPPTWENMEAEQAVTYEFVSETELRLTFDEEGVSSTLVFSL